jgi:4-hydroxy-4-methyl-2-oxoglutarate aldolase
MIFSIEEIRSNLYSAVIADALDGIGYKHQSPNIILPISTVPTKIVGRSKTTLWADIYHTDPSPYELELKAVDSCLPGEVLIAAAGGSNRSGIWGELLSTAASNRGCVGAIVHGCVRDVSKIAKMGFPVLASGIRVYDSQNRQMVIQIDVPVELGGVIIHPGDLVFCDDDGMVVIPQEIEEEVILKAMLKVDAENITRDEIKNGMLAEEAYRKYGIL